MAGYGKDHRTKNSASGKGHIAGPGNLGREPKGSMPTDKQGYRIPSGMRGHGERVKPNKRG